MDVTIRKMTKDDLATVLDLGGNLLDMQDLAKLDLGSQLEVSFVAEVDGQLVGFNLAHIRYVGIPLTKVCFIDGIVVEYEYRRQGIGNKLIDKMVESCHMNGIGTVRALVDTNDEQLRRLVESLGFRRSIINNYDMIILDNYQSCDDIQGADLTD